MLTCVKCGKPFDFDQGPDEGSCLVPGCGGALIEEGENRPGTTVGSAACAAGLQTVASDALAGAHINRGSVPRGEN